jgi:hypothetical protein
VAAHPMSDDEVRAFVLAEPPHTAKVATVRADGSPHLAPVWFALDPPPPAATTRWGTSSSAPTSTR